MTNQLAECFNDTHERLCGVFNNLGNYRNFNVIVYSEMNVLLLPIQQRLQGAVCYWPPVPLSATAPGSAYYSFKVTELLE